MSKTQDEISVKLGQKPHPLALSTFGEEEMLAVKHVLASGRLTMGDEVKAFEREFAEWTGSKFALMVNSGSSANLLMVDSLLRRTNAKPLLNPGDEVIVPALTWPTTVWPILQLGLVPVFADIGLKNMALDLGSVESVLTPKTKALFLVHVLGQTPPISEYVDFCKRHNLILLEDVCESLGAFSKGTHAGNFGVMGSFSAYFSHHISAIEGGVIITSDAKLYDDLLSLRAHGWLRGRSDQAEWIEKYPDIDPRFMFITGGYNVRPMEIQAAIARVQLRKLNRMLEERERLARCVRFLTQRYTPWMHLVGSERLSLESAASWGPRARQHSWMTLPFLVEPTDQVNAKKVMQALERQKIETRPIIAGNLARHPAAQAYHIRCAASLANADYVFQNGFMIGCHPLHVDEALQSLEEAFKQISLLSNPA